jgi:hypothetical protein
MEKEQVIKIKTLLNEGIKPGVIAEQLNIASQIIYRINNGKAYRDIEPFTKKQQWKVSRSEPIVLDTPATVYNDLIKLTAPDWIKEILVERLREEEVRLKREVAITQLKIDALRTRDATYLPAIAIKEFEDKGIMIDGKFPPLDTPLLSEPENEGNVA